MEQANCLYCENNFDKGTFLPLTLVCGHTFCKSCVNELKYYTRVCPFDKSRVNYLEFKINEKLVESIKAQCRIHASTCIGYCRLHLEIICKLCISNHSSCPINEGSLESLNQNLTNKILKYSDKVLAIDEKLLRLKVSDVLTSYEYRFYGKIQEMQQIIYNFTESAHNTKTEKYLLLKTDNALCINTMDSLKCINQAFSDIYNSEVLSMESLEEFLHLLNQNSNFDPRVLEEMNLLYDLNLFACIYKFFSYVVDKKYRGECKIFEANLTQIKVKEFFFDVIGIGGAYEIGEYVSINKLQIFINGKMIIDIQHRRIKRANERICSFLVLPLIIKIPQGSQVLMCFEMENTNSCLFSKSLNNEFVQVFNTAGQPYIEAFPVLFLGCVKNERDLSIFE